MDRAAIGDFIVRQRYGVVSSIASDGSPQSALVGVTCTTGLQLIFDTLNTSRKYANLIQRPVCSVVVGCCGEQTLQLEGVATEPKGEELRQFQEVYFSQWPECREHLSWPGIAYLVIRPRWIRYSDYDQKPVFLFETGETSRAGGSGKASLLGSDLQVRREVSGRTRRRRKADFPYIMTR